MKRKERIVYRGMENAVTDLLLTVLARQEQELAAVRNAVVHMVNTGDAGGLMRIFRENENRHPSGSIRGMRRKILTMVGPQGVAMSSHEIARKVHQEVPSIALESIKRRVMATVSVLKKEGHLEGVGTDERGDTLWKLKLTADPDLVLNEPLEP